MKWRLCLHSKSQREYQEREVHLHLQLILRPDSPMAACLAFVSGLVSAGVVVSSSGGLLPLYVKRALSLLMTRLSTVIARTSDCSIG